MKLFAFEGYTVCVNTEGNNQHCGQVVRVGWGVHTHTHTVVNTFLPACMKGLFRPAVPLQAQLWSLTLFRENISFTLWCLLIYKKANPTLKIACLKQRKDEANTPWDTDARENHLYFPFRSHDHLVILRHCWFEGRNRSEKKEVSLLLYVSPQLKQDISFQLDCIVSDMSTDFYLLSISSCIQQEIIIYYYQMLSVVES